MRLWSFIFAIAIIFTSFAGEVLAEMDENRVFRRAYVEPGTDDNEGKEVVDPARQGGLYLYQVIFEDLFEPPMRYDREGEIVPAGIDSWYYSDDGMSIFLELNPDKIWSDGVPVTAEDYVFAIKRMKDPEFAKAPPAFITSSIVGFEPDTDQEIGVYAESPTLLRIDMTASQAITEPTLTEIGFVPLPRHKSPDGLVPWSDWPGGVTNGPYTLKSIEGKKLTFERNPNAPEGLKPNFDYLETYLYDWTQAASEFLSGKVDYLYGVPERQLAWFTENNVKTYPVSARLYYYALNPKFEGMKDKRVRRAMRMAIDRPSLVKQIFPSDAQPAYSLIPEGIRGYTPDPSLRLDDIDANFAEAKKLMEEAGYGPDNRLKVKISSNVQVQHRNIAEFVKLGWATIYVDAELDIVDEDFTRWFKGFTEGNYEVARRSWNTSKPTMEAFMTVCKPLNDPRCGYYDDKLYEEILLKAAAEPDLDKRRDLFREADRMIVDADVLAPLFHGTILIALSDRLDTSWIGSDIRNIRSYELKLKE